MASESFRILGVPETLVSDLWVLLGFGGFSFGYPHDWKAFFCISSFLQGLVCGGTSLDLKMG